MVQIVTADHIAESLLTQRAQVSLERTLLRNIKTVHRLIKKQQFGLRDWLAVVILQHHRSKTMRCHSPPES
ncbi:hypothetical protein ACNKHR_26015 [Shigella flexneri]